MSERALPILFLNLAGEMLYVLDQRLYAQKIPNDKGKKILEDIVINCYSERFLDEIFKPQEMCSKKAIKTIFERLAHTSIMRLNQNSMDKLFDLMTMAVKYQISLVSKPKEIILVTLNHMDSIQPFVSHSNTSLQLIENCYKRIFKTYLHLNDFELQYIRHTILNFFLDLRIKVSVFLREKVQNWDGSFVLFYDGPVTKGSDVPGTITYYDSRDGKSVFKETKFNTSARYLTADSDGSYERYGDRVTRLGLNVYNSSKVVDTILSNETNNETSGIGGSTTRIVSDYESIVHDPKATAQLDLLCRLISGKSSSSKHDGGIDFKLNLFNNEEEEFIYKTQMKTTDIGDRLDDRNSKTIKFDASRRHVDDRLNKVIDQFSSNKKSSYLEYDYDGDEGDENRHHRGHQGDVIKHQSSINRRQRENVHTQNDYQNKKYYTQNKNYDKSQEKNENDDDDDDDIIGLMDRINRK